MREDPSPLNRKRNGRMNARGGSEEGAPASRPKGVFRQPLGQTRASVNVNPLPPPAPW